MNTEADRQAFEIWKSSNPTITLGDLISAGVVSSYHTASKEVFFSDTFEYKRWLIVSGFQEFINSRSDSVYRQEEWEECECTEPSERQKAESVIRSLFRWMKKNEKQLTNTVG